MIKNSLKDGLTLEWLGTGSAMNYELGNSNFILSSSSSKAVVDLSANNANMLVSRNFELGGLTDFIITHNHGDHVDGLEGVGFLSWNALGRKDRERPNLYVATTEMFESLAKTFYDKMKDQQDSSNNPFQADLDFYFNLVIGIDVEISGLPKMELHQTEHVQGMESYGVHVPEYGLWVSGDAREVKDLPKETVLAFRDAGGPGNEARVHSDLELDLANLPDEEKKITYLYHMGGNWRNVKPRSHGFAGMSMPGDKYVLDGEGYQVDMSGAFIHQRVPFTDERE